MIVLGDLVIEITRWTEKPPRSHRGLWRCPDGTSRSLWSFTTPTTCLRGLGIRWANKRSTLCDPGLDRHVEPHRGCWDPGWT